MNQESNNLNQNNFNTQGNNGIPNNQPLNNVNSNINSNPNQNQNLQQSTNTNQTQFNSQPQMTPNYQQPINQTNTQEHIPQPINAFESENVNNQSFNSKPPKKKSLGLIIGIVSIFAVAIISGIFLLNNSNNNPANNNSINNNKNSINIGSRKIPISTDENKVNGYGLFKLNNEYIYKGGDYYTNTDSSGNTSKEFEQGYLNNFVKFNNNYWRIIKINENGTIKLVWAGTNDGEKISNVLNLEIKYVENKTDDFSYENSYLRNYLNNNVLNNTSIIPSNYKDYLIPSNWDISTYNIFAEIVKEEKSTFTDYIGVLSVKEYEDASYCYKITTGTGYEVEQCENYIQNILETAKNRKQLDTNTTNVVVDEASNKTMGVSKIQRSNGEFKIGTEYNIDRNLENNVLPVIVLKSNVKFSSGDGTVKNPFIIK